jgi:Flp pilus assembly protein TadB
MILFGAGCAVLLFAERRKKCLRRRLAAICAGTQADGEVGFPLTLRVPPTRRLRGLYLLPPGLLTHLDTALAATGNRIGLPLLILSGAISAVIVIEFMLKLTQIPLALAIALGSCGAFGGPALLLRLAQARYQRRFLELFPDALDLIARAVRAGLPALEAIDLSAREIAPPVGTEFRQMLDKMRLGIEIEVALRETADRVRVPDFRFFVVCLVLQRRTGGGLAETLSNLSALIRQRRVVRLKARAMTAEIKASTAVVATMPLAAGVGLFFVNSQMMASLFLDPRGRFMLATAILSLSLGIFIMIGMIRKGPRY